MPEPIDDTSGNIAAALMAAPPRCEQDWRYKEPKAPWLQRPWLLRSVIPNVTSFMEGQNRCRLNY